MAQINIEIRDKLLKQAFNYALQIVDEPIGDNPIVYYDKRYNLAVQIINQNGNVNGSLEMLSLSKGWQKIEDVIFGQEEFDKLAGIRAQDKSTDAKIAMQQKQMDEEAVISTLIAKL